MTFSKFHALIGLAVIAYLSGSSAANYFMHGDLYVGSVAAGAALVAIASFVLAWAYWQVPPKNP
jgi:hypothetical protein